MHVLWSVKSVLRQTDVPVRDRALWKIEVSAEHVESKHVLYEDRFLKLDAWIYMFLVWLLTRDSSK